MGPKLTRLIERIRWVKKTIIPTVTATIAGGGAGAGYTPIEFGISPFWDAAINAVLCGVGAGVPMFYSIYKPTNGPKPL